VKNRFTSEKEGVKLAREFCELFKKGIPCSLDLFCVVGGVEKAARLDLGNELIPKQQIKKIVSFLKENEIPHTIINQMLYVLAPQTENPEQDFKVLERALKLKGVKDWKSKEEFHRLLGEFFGIPKSAIEDFIKDQFELSTASAIGPAFSLPQFRANLFAGFHYNRETRDKEVLEIIKRKEAFIKKYFPYLYRRWIEVQKFIDKEVYGRKKF